MESGPKLTREILEAVFDTAKELGDVVDKAKTKIDQYHAGGGPEVYGWMGFHEIVDSSPFLQQRVLSAIDFLRCTGDEMRHSVAQYLPSGAKEIFSDEEIMRIRFLSELEQWFRAGWEARGAADQAE